MYCRAGSRRTTSSSPRATGRGDAVHGHAADALGGRAHLGQARAPLPRGRPGLRGPLRRKFDADGRDASLPTSRHVISNLES